MDSIRKMKNYENVNENISLKIKEIKRLKEKDFVYAKKMEDNLIVSLSYLVHSVVYRYRKFDNYDDLYQEGMVGLIRAVQKYDSDTSFHFTRYALWWIKTRVMRSIKKINIVPTTSTEEIKNFSRYEINDNDIVDYNNPEKDAILNQEIKYLNNLINDLPENHRKIIKMRYGVNNTKVSNLEDLSQVLDMTSEGVRQLEYRILNKLKNNNINITNE